MANQVDHSSWRTGTLLRGAAVFVVLYALVAAWIVVSDANGPDPVRLARTDDGAGLVVSGSVPDADDRAALIEAVGAVTDAPLIIAQIEVDPDADPIDEPLETAAALADALPPDDS